jgi:flavin-dependent thymidylate synthase
MSLDPGPRVELVSALGDPYNTVVAAARTCYSPRVVMPSDVVRTEKSRKMRDRIYDSIYDAGHHTTMQHPTFLFALRRVSRQFLWSFLHAHPFFNSEQVSQRYVEVKPENFAIPPMPDAARAVYAAAVARMVEGYFGLIEAIRPDVAREYFVHYPARRRDPDRWADAIHKRVLEAARYVLPVSIHAHLYHTISGLTLHRYRKLCQPPDAPAETRLVVEKMSEAVRAVDPDFFRKIDDPVPLEETLEHRMFNEVREASPGGGEAFVREFDAELGPLVSRLVDTKTRAVEMMGRAVRSVLGVPREAMTDAEAVDRVMNPARNRHLVEALSLTTMSKLSRAMNHPHFTFMKKISHAADSQNQRHRMVPGTRPVLAAHVLPGRPDYILPPVMARNAKVRETVAALMKETWEAIGRLRDMGADAASAHYLLPNAFPIRFEESGDLMHFGHKWTTRMCHLAQEEIWRACVDEVRQVSELHPEIGRYLRAPCGLRKMAGRTPFCPEGSRYCGMRVWDRDLGEYDRLI